MSVFSFTRSILYFRGYSGSTSTIHGFNATRSTFNQKPDSSPVALYLLNKAKPYRQIPKVPMFPFVGTAWANLPYIGKFNPEELHIADIHKYRTYGDLVRERFGRFEMVSCYHPDAVSVMMQADDKYESRGDFASLKLYRRKRKHWYGAGGLLVTEGKQWHDLRTLIEDYMMDPEFYGYYTEPLNSIAKDFVEVIRKVKDGKNEVDDAVSLLNRWALEGMAYVSMDERLGCLKPDLAPDSDGMQMINSIKDQVDCMHKLEASAGNIPLWKVLPTPTWRQFVKAADTFSSIAFRYITSSAYRSSVGSLNDGQRPSLLQHLTITKQSGIPKAMVLMADLMMAGINTTTYAAAFLLYNLATNPQKQAEAIKEIDRLLTNKDEFTFEMYEKCEYLQHCLKESMRLHPITRGQVRTYDKDAVIRGYRIPAGTTIMCVLQVIYRNPKFFASPNEFIPERWYDDRQPYPFFQPFGEGIRRCVGSKLAELNILLLVTEVLRNFTVEYHHEPIGMRTKLLNIPDRPMKLTFLQR